MYWNEKHVPEVVGEFQITFVKLIFVGAFLADTDTIVYCAR